MNSTCVSFITLSWHLVAFIVPFDYFVEIRSQMLCIQLSTLVKDKTWARCSAHVFGVSLHSTRAQTSKMKVEFSYDMDHVVSVFFTLISISKQNASRHHCLCLSNTHHRLHTTKFQLNLWINSQQILKPKTKIFAENWNALSKCKPSFVLSDEFNWFRPILPNA